jgi:ATP-binding cassette, subfamily G (WHITE), member 2, PDR
MGTFETGDLVNVENASPERDETSSTPEVKDRSDDEGRARTEFEVAELAKTLTGQSTWSNVPDNPLDGEKDCALDPNSTNFRARQWVKSMVKLQQADNKNPGRTAGIAFQDLNVHGFGEATDYQKDVGNVWLELIGYGKRLFGIGKRPCRIEILRDFEGIVESGEMLVVLGPPGSGCSSFLKTITGETHGFVVDDNSYLNYQGIRATQMHKYFRGEAIYTAEGQFSAYHPCLRPRDVHYRV